MQIAGIDLELKVILKKKSVKSGMWMYFLQVFNTIVPLLTLPYITRILGTSKYGIFSIALNIIGYYQVVVEYGFGMSATRKVALFDTNQNEINKAFSAVLLSRVVLLLTCGVITVVSFLLSMQSIEQGLCLLILLVCLFGYCVQQNWLFQGMQQMKYISLINIVCRSSSVALIFLLVKTQQDLFLYCLLYAISPFLSGIFGLVFAKRRYKIKFVKTTVKDVFSELKNGWYVFTTQLSSKIFGAIGVTFLSIFATNSEVGIYSAIQKIPNIMMLAWLPIGQAIYPISSKQMQVSFENGKAFVYKLRKLFLPLFTLGAFLVAMFSKAVVTIVFGAEYARFYYWILPLLGWMVISINNNFWGVQILLGSGHDKEYSKCFQLGVLCTIVFNLGLILLFGGSGASLAPFLSEVVLGIALRYEISKIDKLRCNLNK